jgi:hypothetical protein
MAKSLTFPYVELPIRNPATKILVGTIFRPLIPIQIGYQDKFSLTFEALVDSGADKSLFPLEIGQQIGIDFSKIKPNNAKGIGGKEIKTYSSAILLKTKRQTFKTEADFSSEIDYPLLGRDGFFGLFSKLEFDQKKKRLILHLKLSY